MKIVTGLLVAMVFVDARGIYSGFWSLRDVASDWVVWIVALMYLIAKIETVKS